MIKFIEQYKQRFLARVWKDSLKARMDKKAAYQARIRSVEPVTTAPLKTQVPVHPLHVVFDRSYLTTADTTDVAEVEKTKEEIRHIAYHHHQPQFAF